jgi:hypothetical protein
MYTKNIEESKQEEGEQHPPGISSYAVLMKGIEKGAVDPEGIYVHYKHGGRRKPDQVHWKAFVDDKEQHVLLQFLHATKRERMENECQMYAYDQLKRLLADPEVVVPIKTGPQRLAEQMEAEKMVDEIDEDMDHELHDTQETCLPPVVDDDFDQDLDGNNVEDDSDDSASGSDEDD